MEGWHSYERPQRKSLAATKEERIDQHIMGAWHSWVDVVDAYCLMGTFDSQREKLKKVSRVENCEKVPVETLTIKILGPAVECEEFTLLADEAFVLDLETVYHFVE